MECMVSTGWCGQQLPMGQVLAPGLRCSVEREEGRSRARDVDAEERPRSLKLINTIVIPYLL